jgi:hypothetical protein
MTAQLTQMGLNGAVVRYRSVQALRRSRQRVNGGELSVDNVGQRRPTPARRGYNYSGDQIA